MGDRMEHATFILPIRLLADVGKVAREAHLELSTTVGHLIATAIMEIEQLPEPVRKQVYAIWGGEVPVLE